MSRQEEISQFLQGEIDSSEATRELCSHDASIFEIKPELVIYPKNVEDLKKLVKYASEHEGVSLTARSAGTDMSGGPLSSSLVLHFTKYFNQILEVGDGYARVQPGVFFRDFDKATQAHGGQIMPSYPASRELCTVGGITANNSGGEKTLTYGKTERYVRKVKTILSDGSEAEFRALSEDELNEKTRQQNLEGEIYRKMKDLILGNWEKIKAAKPIVSKNSCGYFLWNVWDEQKKTFDLTKLIVGSQGTLCLLDEIEFTLVKPKTHSRLLVVFLNDLKLLGVTVNHVLQFAPESFESYDDHTFKIAMKFLPQLMRQMGGNLVTLGLEFLPELVAVLEGGVPKLVLMAEFTADSDEEALAKAESARLSLADLHEKTRVTKSEGDTKKYWVIRRESFNMLRHHIKDVRTAPFIDDFAVLPEKLPEFLPKLYSILDQYDLTYTIAGHVGDGNFHIIPLMNLHEEKSRDIIKDLSVKVYELVHEYKGTITAEHNDGLIRTPFIKMQYGEDIYKLFEETKKIWDPKNIFNPGKKVGGNMDFAFSHLVQ